MGTEGAHEVTGNQGMVPRADEHEGEKLGSRLHPKEVQEPDTGMVTSAQVIWRQ